MAASHVPRAMSSDLNLLLGVFANPPRSFSFRQVRSVTKRRRARSRLETVHAPRREKQTRLPAARDGPRKARNLRARTLRRRRRKRPRPGPGLEKAWSRVPRWVTLCAPLRGLGKSGVDRRCVQNEAYSLFTYICTVSTLVLQLQHQRDYDQGKSTSPS